MRSPRPGTPRPWPLEPLYSYVAASRDLTPHVDDGPCLGCGGWSDPRYRRCLPLTELARLLSVESRSMQRWRTTGLTDDQADQLAVRAGTHPGAIWPDWFEAGLEVLDDVFLHGTDTAEPGWRPAANYPLPGVNARTGSSTIRQENKRSGRCVNSPGAGRHPMEVCDVNDHTRRRLSQPNEA